MATITQKQLFPSAYLASTVGTVVTNPAATKTYVRNIHLFNNQASTTETVTIYRVPNSTGSVGTAGVSNLYGIYLVPAQSTLDIECPSQGIVLDGTNDTIQAFTTTASKVICSIDGTTEA